ncbi:MAG: Citrate transporter [Methanoregula sp. PtaU1.Bin051]|nr:MAG: Citrate transporter [Methanoregula sp. PtaU1.Bin051]
MLAAVFLFIAVRQVGRFRFAIWQVMLLGALAVLLTGQISPLDALHSINVDVMVFLFGMFIVGEALASSGYLECFAHRFYRHAGTPQGLIILIVLSTGLLSAFLMNDTLAIIGTPLVLALAKRHRISPKLMLLSLAIAITTGSVLSPIGNPQNMLVATDGGMASPFVTFAQYLLIPTVLNLLVAVLFLRFFFRTEFASRSLKSSSPGACDRRSVHICQCSLAIILFLIGVKTAASLLGLGIIMPLPLLAICAAAPVLIFSEDRSGIVKRIDWCTLVFFAAMFVLMASVWQTGFFQSFIDNGATKSVPVILTTSIIASQFISNVPFVALYLPLLQQSGSSADGLIALAAGSTIAGNLTILGAASNVIIIQNADKQGETITFAEFAKIGIPLTIVQAMVYWIWLSII